MPDWRPPRRELVGYGIQVGAAERQALKEVVERVPQALLQPLPLLQGAGSGSGGGGGGGGGSEGGSAGQAAGQVILMGNISDFDLVPC